MTKFTSPTSNRTFPVTRRECNQDPQTCEHMEGTKIGKKLYDARCNLPLPEGEFTVEIEGWGATIPITKEELTQPKAICGFDSLKGIRRRV